jgi:cytochrome b subunit of formate dehydrogenase
VKDWLRTDKTVAVEVLSAMSFFVMGLALLFSNYASPDTRSNYFWSIIFLIFSTLQGLSIGFKKEMYVVRVTTAWFSGTTWIVLAFTAINNIMAVPVLFIGLFNIYAFVHLVGRAKIDWTAYIHQNKNVDTLTQ